MGRQLLGLGLNPQIGIMRLGGLRGPSGLGRFGGFGWTSRLGGWPSWIYAWRSWIYGGGPCDYCVSPSPFSLDFGTLDFGLGLDNWNREKLSIVLR